MKTAYTIAVSILIGLTIGAAAVEVLHAQAKPPVYAIALNQLTDPEGYAKDYLPKGKAAILAHGGVYVAAGKGTLIVGDVPHDRVAVLKFENLEAVKTWFNSPDYKRPTRLDRNTLTTTSSL